MSRHRVIPAIMVNINKLPDRGYVQLITRLAQRDVNTINQAAEAMRMRQSDFLRVALVRVAEQVLPMIYGTRGNPHATSPQDDPAIDQEGD